MSIAENPILRGFNPDPSIIRVEDDFYIATSTFEWFPGVQIHHSKDLVNWQLITRPLNRLSQLDLRGVPDSCGVWAPCLSYDDGIFYLLYSNVKSFSGVWKDTPNYLVTANNIMGPWSDPLFLSASGFDASLFHDDDDRKWFLSMYNDHRKGKFFGGIFMQEFNVTKGMLEGTVYNIFEGTHLGCVEGPHLYKKDGYYYLITAEGGTEYGHAVTVARSKTITGPYEVHPQNPILTSRYNPDHPLQKAGHADFVQAKDGNWYVAFLVGRPLTPQGYCILGRETAIESLDWSQNGWPVLSTGGKLPRMQVQVNIPSTTPVKSNQHFDDFDSDNLNIHFQSLRIPFDELCSLKERKGSLCIKGGESLSSFNRQALVARRIQNYNIEASTCIDFHPRSFQQMAGLICYYNTAHFHYLHLSANDEGKRCLQIITFDFYKQTEALERPLEIPEAGIVYMKVVLKKDRLQFYYAIEENNWQKIGAPLDATILSDDYIREVDTRYQPAFTGSFVGMCCQDLTGNNHPAYFNWFQYAELENETEVAAVENKLLKEQV